MRRWGLCLLSVLLAVGIHVDWHLARPHHHRLSLEWREHWIFSIVLFALVGMIVARLWPAVRWRAGTWTLALWVVLAQVVEPVLEAVFYDHRLAYDVEPARWTAFFVCLAAGIPACALALWLFAPRSTRAAPPEGFALP
jgi:uncharacterized membrane protein YagU involved in acid resistance